MSVESILFILVGILTVGSAGLMLLSKNAIHSALFLIANFIGVALLYLMLEAPFLALVQIAVYAGAIMVLFLFVIMLLGAEKTGKGAHLRRFPWLPPVGMGLVAFLVIIGAIAFSQGNIDSLTPPAGESTVRFVHAAPVAVVAAAPVEEAPATDETGAEVPPTGTTETSEAPASDAPSRPAVPLLPDNRVFALFVDGVEVDGEFAFGDSTEPMVIDPGAHTVTLRAAGSEEDIRTTEFNLEAGASATLVIAGEVDLDFFTVPLSETAGVTIFNAYGLIPALNIADLQNELFDPKMNSVSNVMTGRMLLPVAEGLAYGQSTSVLQYPAGFANWVAYQPVQDLTITDGFVPDGDQLRRALVLRLTESLGLRTGENSLIVIAPERRADGSVRAVAEELFPVELAAFGSPASLGERLFTDYLLPFQLVAMLLLAAMVGVIVITYRGEHVPKPSRTTRRKVSRPLTSVIASQTGADLTSVAPQLPERTETPAGD